ncbi:hypothetical protein TARUN_6591 [Trichoderma arundinaceum]|uniref:Uncharacterized protein n=1 Tax=Trichoderma arundinaceum TaxID=490622 RepID=A0A395NHT6_TRIAR|nr:hypothetical protein TARUN_6591 [Trichoderma arundinaceum]
MSSSLKNELSSSEFEVEAQDLQLQSELQSKHRLIDVVHGSRLALTILALAAGITVLGVSANGLIVYHETYLPADFYLPLWPSQFDLRPTAALIAGGVVVVVANIVSLFFSKIQALRSLTGAHAITSIAAPAVGFIASLVAMALFYAVNSSSTVDSLQSWTCRWNDIPMTTQPHFGTLCNQSQAGVALAVLLVPLEAIILAAAGYQAVLERRVTKA